MSVGITIDARLIFGTKKFKWPGKKNQGRNDKSRKETTATVRKTQAPLIGVRRSPIVQPSPREQRILASDALFGTGWWRSRSSPTLPGRRFYAPKWGRWFARPEIIRPAGPTHSSANRADSHAPKKIGTGRELRSASDTYSAEA